MVRPGGITVGSYGSGRRRRSAASGRRALSSFAALAAVGALLGALVLAPAALAGKPTGEFAVFSDCPLSTKGVNQCVYAQFSSGEVALGGLRYAISKTITLQGV